MPINKRKDKILVKFWFDSDELKEFKKNLEYLSKAEPVEIDEIARYEIIVHQINEVLINLNKREDIEDG